MRKALILSLVIALVFLFNGCGLTNQNRPAPIRPRTSPRQQAPTKRVPEVSRISKKTLEDRLVKIEEHIKKGDWSMANSEVNSLGGDMARFYPTSAKGKSLKEMAIMDADYVKLQADMKTKKKDSALDNVAKLRRTLGKVE